MRVILDTNILVSALITRDTPPDKLYRLWQAGRFDLLTSEWQIAELRDVTKRPKVAALIEPRQAGVMVNLLRRRALLVEQPKSTVLTDEDLSPDPDDNPLLAIAVVNAADALVTGDKGHLLALTKVGRTPIVTAVELLRRLNAI